jgi:hypothetical protein
MDNNKYKKTSIFDARWPLSVEFAVALAVVLSARASMIFPLNYGSDDYAWSYRSLSSGYRLFASEGRHIIYLINWLAELFGSSFPFLGAYWNIIASAGAVFLGTIFRKIWLNNCPSLAGIAAVLIFSLFPYQCDLFNFHIAMPCIALSFIFGAIAINSEKKNITSLIISLILFVVAINYQLFITYFLIGILFIFIIKIIKNNHFSFQFSGYVKRHKFELINISMLFLSVIIFIVSKKFISEFEGILTSERSEIASLYDMPDRLILLVKELQYFMFRKEALIPQFTKILQIILIFFTVCSLFYQYTRDGTKVLSILTRVTFILFLISVAFAITAAPFMILKYPSWSLSMRSLSSISIFWSGIFALAWFVSPQKARNFVVILGFIIAFSYSCQVNQYSVDFARVNMRERHFANRVIERLSQSKKFANVKTIIFVGLDKKYFTNGLKTPVVSSMFYPQDTVAVLSEISGNYYRPATIQELIQAEELAKSLPLWPDLESCVINGEIAVIAISRAKSPLI